jgi:hypothetical protein
MTTGQSMYRTSCWIDNLFGLFSPETMPSWGVGCRLLSLASQSSFTLQGWQEALTPVAQSSYRIDPV